MASGAVAPILASAIMDRCKQQPERVRPLETPIMTPSEQRLCDELAQLKVHLEQCESELKAARSQLNFIDEAMPAMLAYIDSHERYLYHNRAFRDWLGLDAAQIDGHTMREVLGEDLYVGAAPRVKQALDGKAVRYERTQKTPDGGRYRQFVYLIPHFDDNGSAVGIYALLDNQALRALQAEPGAAGRVQASTVDGPPASAAAGDITANIQALYDNSLVGTQTSWKNAADRIKSAIDNNEFRLYAQSIKDLRADKLSFEEIYIRLGEEEEAFMHPGAFLPVAESVGLMPEIDRWVVTNVLKWISARRQADPKRHTRACCVILSGQTLSDPYFPEFVGAQLALSDVPGKALRFEIHESDVSAQPADAAHLIEELAHLGCWTVLGGFGRDIVSFKVLKDVQVRFLKIDSKIVLQILRDKSAAAKLKAISHVAQSLGIKTIAEFVESDAAIAKLREAGIDYAQGLGISPPMPLEDIGRKSLK
jgi:PAS domain S-box-containing protein